MGGGSGGARANAREPGPSKVVAAAVGVHVYGFAASVDGCLWCVLVRVDRAHGERVEFHGRQGDAAASHLGLRVLGGACHAQGDAVQHRCRSVQRALGTGHGVADECRERTSQETVEPSRVAVEGADGLRAACEEAGEALLVHLGEEVKFDLVARLDASREIERSDAGDAVGAEEDLALFECHGSPVAHQGEHAVDSQTVETLEKVAPAGLIAAGWGQSAGDGAQDGGFGDMGQVKDFTRSPRGSPACEDDGPSEHLVIEAVGCCERLARVADAGLLVAAGLMGEG